MAAGTTDEEELRAVWALALAEVAPGAKVAAALAGLPEELGRRPRYVISVGKAAYAMLDGVDAWEEAVAVGPAAEAAAAARVEAAGARRRLMALAGAHPVPDASSVAAAAALEALVARVPADGVLIALVSGGASAMVARPREGLSLEEKVAATSRRMAQGASIAELNELRRALSAVKGGRLIEGCAAPVVSLIVSDVAGDDPRVIASGLTISSEAAELAQGAASEAPPPGAPREAPPPGAPRNAASPRARDRYRIVAGQDAVARAAARLLAGRGWAVSLRGEPMVGDVVEVADALWAARPPGGAGRRALVAYGEPTVRVPQAAGIGGRAQQLALLLAERLDGSSVTALAAGTDGVDGPGLPPVAGAIVDGRSWRRLAAAGVDAAGALARCDARPALAAIDALLATGPTGRNHADVMILLAR